MPLDSDSLDDQSGFDLYEARLDRMADLLSQRRTLVNRVKVVDEELRQLRYQLSKNVKK